MMKQTTLGALIIGFLSGVVVTSVTVFLIRGKGGEEQREESLRSPHGDADKARARLRKEFERLESVEKPEPAPPTPPVEEKREAKKEPVPKEEPPPIVGFGERISALAEEGMAAVYGLKGRALAKEMKAGGAEARRVLAEILSQSESANERFTAAALMEFIGDPEGVPDLASAIRGESDLLVRRMIAHAIAVIGADTGVEALREAMASDGDWGVRVNSAYGLAKMGKEDGLNHLMVSYGSEETPAEARLAILGGLVDVAAPSSAPLFRRILSDTTDVSYLIASITALTKMKDVASIPDLERVVSSTLPETVREAAGKAILKIQE